jgi:hypothetical protein
MVLLIILLIIIGLLILGKFICLIILFIPHIKQIKNYYYKNAVPFSVAGSFNNWNPELMKKGRNINIYKLTNFLPAGTYEYKIKKNDIFCDGANRCFTLATNKKVTFYAKSNGNTYNFFCDAQDIFLVGDITGGTNFNDKKQKPNKQKPDKSIWDIANTGSYMLKVKDNDGSFIDNDILSNVQNIENQGTHKIIFKYNTFRVSYKKSQ